MTDELQLNISGFEGPLDLLLELAKKQKVDLTKLSILELTDQFLIFVKNHINQLNLTADYLVMASYLAYLKSKLLLPKEENTEADDLEYDLTKRLIHYNAIKIASEKINNLFQEGKDFFTRQFDEKFVVSHKIVINVTFHDLLNTYLKIEKNRKKINFHLDKNHLFTVEDGNKWLKYFFNKNNLEWENLFSYLPKQIENIILKKSAVVSILQASLKLAQDGKLEIYQSESFKNIQIRLKDNHGQK
ncbi:MAG: hypothetical protein CMP33_05330 [Rickettsiales bacterium]|nr:hypothetical protein [Rickettsiales bacterium]